MSKCIVLTVASEFTVRYNQLVVLKSILLESYNKRQYNICRTRGRCGEIKSDNRSIFLIL